jgi:carbonic anhydrase
MQARIFLSIAVISMLLVCAQSAFSEPVCAPEPPDRYQYTPADIGPDCWNQLYPDLCAHGGYQSPFEIDPKVAVRANLPKLRFFYNEGHVTNIDHGDQVAIDHGAGNYIMIGKQRYNLTGIHVHTPAEYQVAGRPQYPLEIHFVHADPTGTKFAVVGVFVTSGKEDKGIIMPPSCGDPDDVDIEVKDLIPPKTKRDYWRFDGSLTTPTLGRPTPLPPPPYCGEAILWTQMKKPISMSPGQIAAFECSTMATYGTQMNARPLQPANNRVITSPK